MKHKKKILSGLRRNNMKKKLGEICVYCGCTNKVALTIDHKIPFRRGGKDTEDNKQVCCFICNQLKGALTHNEFKKYLKALEILKDLNKLYINLPEPEIKLRARDFPLTEKQVINEMKKDAKSVGDGKK